MKKILHILSWFFGCLFGIGGLSLLLEGDVLFGLIFGVSALILIPPLKIIILNKFPKIKKSYLDTIIALVCVGVFINIIYATTFQKVTSIDGYTEGQVTHTQTDSITLSGTTRSMKSVDIVIEQYVGSTKTETELSVPVTENTFTTEIPTRNLLLGKQDYPKTTVHIKSWGDLIFIRDLTEEEQLKRDERINTLKQQEQEKIDLKKKEEETYLNSPAGKLCTENPSWSEEACELIAKKEIAIGMTPEQVTAAWGKPRDINRTTHVNYTQEQWVYHNNQYLYFLNDMLETIQQ